MRSHHERIIAKPHLRLRKRRTRRKSDHHPYQQWNHILVSSRLLLVGVGVGIYYYGYFHYYYHYFCTFHRNTSIIILMNNSSSTSSTDNSRHSITVTTPNSLRRSVNEFLHPPQSDHHSSSTTKIPTTTLSMDVNQYWSVLNSYAKINNGDSPTVTAPPPNSNTTASTNLEDACTDLPGHGWEGGHGAYQLLTHKIQIAPNQNRSTSSTLDHVSLDHFNEKNQIRLLCAIYTHQPNHDLVRMAALTWGLQCDGFIAFTNTTDTSSTSHKITNTNNNLGIISIPLIGVESYANMWQKTRAIWHYIYTHYYSDYDYIHLSGDDIYLIVPNLKYFLYKQQELDQQYSRSTPSSSTSAVDVFAGQWVRQKNRPYVGGGPGYTISRSVLQQYILYAYNDCYPDVTSSAEDRYFSLCLQKYSNVSLTDTRDVETGEQTYHDVAPQQVYDGRPSSMSHRKIPSFHSRAISYYEQLPPPVTERRRQRRFDHSDNIRTTHATLEPWRSTPTTTTFHENPHAVVGPKYGLNAAAKYSISFHKISSPSFMLRIHALLYPSICPAKKRFV